MGKISRRGLLGGIGAAAAAGALPARGAVKASGFVEVMRTPSTVTAFAGLGSAMELTRSGDAWGTGQVSVGTPVSDGAMRVTVRSPAVALTHVRIRWAGAIAGDVKVLGDAWERSYGDLEWRGIVPERAMPWYCAVHAAGETHGYGVKTGAKAMAFWQVDAEGVTLWLDVRNGGEGVRLGDRTLDAVTVVSRRGKAGEDAGAAIAAFCTVMCERPVRKTTAIFGSNDWYYAYGNNTAAGIERDADLMAEVATGGTVRPFTIIDDGWQKPAKFPDMHGLAASIARRGVRPGIWVRPLEAHAGAPEGLLLSAARYGGRTDRRKGLAFDPTVPEALEIVLKKVTDAVAWGYELVKHDFSTYELFGQWGFEMGASPTLAGWGFSDRTKTNAEIVNDLYGAIRGAAGEKTCVIGCNTVGHLSAGVFEANRTGDDVSGKVWERTRKMGVNTLAFRLPQNRRFFVGDADCVPVTAAIPWEKTKMWMDVVARSGTALIVSADPAVVGAEQKTALKEAFALAAQPVGTVTAEDWMETTTPGKWRLGGVKKMYGWSGVDGAWPFGA